MTTSARGKEQLQAKRDLFAELSEGMKALADDRMGNRMLNSYAAEHKFNATAIAFALAWTVGKAQSFTITTRYGHLRNALYCIGSKQ